MKMKLTAERNILDGKIKPNQAQHGLNRQATQISSLSSKNLLDKHEYLTGEDLEYKPNVFEKAKFDYSPLGMSLSKAFKKYEVKSVDKSKSNFSYDSNHTFFGFYKSIDKFKDMSLVIRNLLNFQMLHQQNQKHGSKRSKLQKMLKQFTESIMMPTKTNMTMVVS